MEGTYDLQSIKISFKYICSSVMQHAGKTLYSNFEFGEFLEELDIYIYVYA